MDEEMRLRLRRKKSSVGIICCFTGTTGRHQRRASFDAASYSSAPSPGWFKSKNNADVGEMKGKCRSFISRIGRHRRHASAEFSYDPLSYALNFDDDVDDDSRAMSFSARFPASPMHRSPAHLSRGFESLAESIKASRRNEAGLSSPRAADQKPVPISSNRQILVHLC